jgi:hypothetical protein
MRLIDYFDRGAQLAPDARCFSDLEQSLSYREVSVGTHRIANGLFAMVWRSCYTQLPAMTAILFFFIAA